MSSCWDPLQKSLPIFPSDYLLQLFYCLNQNVYFKTMSYILDSDWRGRCHFCSSVSMQITFNAKAGLRVDSRCGGNQECSGLRHSPFPFGMGRSHAPPASPVLSCEPETHLSGQRPPCSNLAFMVPRETSVQDRTL